MPSTVYYGSPRQARLEAKETLPAKLDLIIEKLQLRERVKDELVAIKVHLGNNVSYSTIHPVFIRKVVQAVKDGGGKPFITDVDWDVYQHETRGYTAESLGCPIYPAAGNQEKYFYSHHHPYKNIQDWKVAGMIEDATFLVDFAHVKGHPSCGFGAAIKNLALGCMVGETRSAMHDTCQYDPYWFPEKCPDEETRQKVKDACPFGCLVDDKSNPNGIHMHYEPCNACGRCLQVAPEGSLKINPNNFYAFQEACAISTSISLGTFKPGNSTFINLATQMTPVCDCFGFTSMQILPDAGIFGSDDIVAIETATLDMIAKSRLIEENIPTSMEVWCREGHPFAQLHGPYKDPYRVVNYLAALGMGSPEYELEDVQPVEEFVRSPMAYISAK